MVVLQQHGVPPKLVEVMRYLHTDTSARVRWGGQRSAPFSMEWGAQSGCLTANPLFNAFINIIVEEAMNSLGNSCGDKVLWKADSRLCRPPQPDSDAQHLLVTLLMLADDLAVAAESVEQAQHVKDALEAATQRWGMEMSLQKTETMVLDPRRSKAAHHSHSGSIQSAPQPTALMPLLSLLLMAVLAIALPRPPAVCIIAATGLCCFVVLVRILLALSYSLSSHSPPLPAAICTSLPAALRRQQPAANHNHQPPNAQPQLQHTASPQPLVQFPCAGMSCLTCNTSAIWAATSAWTVASTRKSAGDLQQRVQQCSGLQSSAAVGTSRIAPRRAYMAGWCFRSCCME
jgi:hypothetical protein